VNEQKPDSGWHNQASVVWAAGVAAVLLLGVLIFAVVHMSGGSPTSPPEPGAPLPSYATPSATTATGTSSTSYAVPSVQTSEPSPGLSTDTTDQPTEQAPDTETAITSTPTTIYNPYVTTTNPAAGHV
jgi:cytoskeletal protein RodZ